MPSVEIVNFFPLAVVVVRRTVGAAFYNILCEVENLYVGRWLHDERLSGLYWWDIAENEGVAFDTIEGLNRHANRLKVGCRDGKWQAHGIPFIFHRLNVMLWSFGVFCISILYAVAKYGKW